MWHRNPIPISSYFSIWFDPSKMWSWENKICTSTLLKRYKCICILFKRDIHLYYCIKCGIYWDLLEHSILRNPVEMETTESLKSHWFLRKFLAPSQLVSMHNWNFQSIFDLINHAEIVSHESCMHRIIKKHQNFSTNHQKNHDKKEVKKVETSIQIYTHFILVVTAVEYLFTVVQLYADFENGLNLQLY